MSAHAHSHENIAPRGALLLACGLVLLTVSLATAVRVGWLAQMESAAQVRSDRHVAPVETRMLRFADTPAGAILVTDAASGATVATLAGEHTGFVRGVMRGLARERHLHAYGPDAPFRLTLWQDGELSLTDTATGRVIELTGFGSTNRAAFAALLKDQRA